MLMHLYKNDELQDLTFEDVFLNNKLRKSINSKTLKQYYFLRDLGVDKEDIHSCINLSLWKAYKSYNYERGYTLSNLALTIITRDLSRMIELQQRTTRHEVQSLNEVICGSEDEDEIIDMVADTTDIAREFYANRMMTYMCARYNRANDTQKELIKYLFGKSNLNQLYKKCGLHREKALHEAHLLRTKLQQHEYMI